MKKLRKIAHHTKMVTLSYLSKIATTPAIIRIVDKVRIAFLLTVAFEVFFLINDRIAIPGLVIVTG